MAHSYLPMKYVASREQEEKDDEAAHDQQIYQHFTSLASTLPRSEGLAVRPLHRHADGWHSTFTPMVSAMVARAHFAARPSDVLVVTAPKSGTTWIKALVFATVRRENHHAHDHPNHPFNSRSPHECVPFLEYQLYTPNNIPILGTLPEPRLFATHVPFGSLPESVVASGCKVVYLCRDPKDNLVSKWHFVNKLLEKDGAEPLPMEKAVSFFCDGMSNFGPFWDHVLGYWNAHLERPDKVLFLRYEEMLRDTAGHVKKLAEFVGCPFSAQEEERGVVDGVVRLCGFEHLSRLDAIKAGATDFSSGAVPNSTFFRRGVVGDWENNLTPAMARQIDEITESKFEGSGLSF